MNSRAIAVTIVFAALTVALNPVFTGIGVPAPYAPFLIYQIWEIPIVAAFLLINPKSGIAISILNAAALLVLFPGALLLGPFYNLVAVLSMLAGIYIAHRILTHGILREKTKNVTLQLETKLITLSTVIGIIFRVGIMSVVNYVVLRYPPPIGYSTPEAAIIASLPLIGLFNATLALYTIPLGHVIANAIRSNLKLYN
jgi:riboflavin transporter FmnP